MRDILCAEFRQAMKWRDSVAVAALRSTLAAIENAEAVDAATREQAPEAKRLAREAAVISDCLPPAHPPRNHGSARP